MPSEFLAQYISAGIAAFLFIIGVIGLLSARFRTGLNALPLVNVISKGLGNPMAVSLILAGVGFFAGGWTYLTAFAGTASIGGSDSNNLDDITSSSMLSYCTYVAGASANSTAVTVRADTGSANRVFVDVDESTWLAQEQTKNEANLTFNCVRSENVKYAGSVEIVANTPIFFAETTVSDSTEYKIVERTTAPSVVWDGAATQTIRLADNGYATASSTKERTTLTFAEGTKERTLGVAIEVDATAYGKLNNYTQKDVTIYQRVNGQDKAVGYVTVNKIP